MAAASAKRSFADTILARLIALLIAVAIGGLFYLYWADDVQRLFAGSGPEIPIVKQQTEVKPANAALQSCLENRVGDVENMKAEGVINDAQYTSFRQRAIDLCNAQNPG